MDAPAILRGVGLTKIYGNLVALRDADFSLRPGEVRALIGSNGAGKSTLIKVFTGAIAPTLGRVEIDGVAAPLGDPSEMIRRGIACIYQHSNLAPAMSVLDNIFLGRQPTRRFGFVDSARQRREARALLERHRIAIDLDATVGNLPTVKQKEVEILKALALDARVILMDEPTAWLAASEVAKLHDTIRMLKTRAVGIVYISHVLDEIFAVCDTMTIMRDGRVIAESAVADIDRPRVVHLMVGEKLARESAEAAHEKRHPRGTGEIRMSARDLTKRGVFTEVSFDLHAGEILCITGLIGSKRTELLRTLFGCDRFDGGTLQIDGRTAAFASPTGAIAAGVGFVPEDRHREGLMLDMTMTENLAMATLDRFHRGLMLQRRRMSEAARQAIASLSIQPPDGSRPVKLLSGGNQQKVLVGKWLNRAPRILILDEPTVGVDVGAKAEIYRILRRERERGAAILVVSSDLEEVFTIADRIGVMVAGRLVRIHDADDCRLQDIVREIGGAAA
ncbi:MAG: ribose import ATP-binding protein RbsA 2 [Alphaproteobacteria bacterium]|nr:MAG: ribose import ATP-binding protein RbsA 2 [Alphaproteobacteria bacterium]